MSESEPRSECLARPAAGVVVAAALGLLAGWTAAGSPGLLAHALRRIIVWTLLGGVLLGGWRLRGRGGLGLAALVACIVAAVVMVAAELPVVNVLAVVVVLGLMALVRVGPDRRALLLACTAVAILALYRHALTSIPFVWLASDALGRALGIVGAGFLNGLTNLLTHGAGYRVWLGASFAGLDVLVVMVALYVTWLVVARPGWRCALIVLAAGVICHLVYLAHLTMAPAYLADLQVPEPEGRVWPPKVLWTWTGSIRELIPWNLPALACILHGLLAVFIFGSRMKPAPALGLGPRRWALIGVAALAALCIPVITTLSPGRCELEGKTVVLNKEGYLNWRRPKHGDYGRGAIGMYGLLPAYVESLGGRCLISETFSEADLAEADVVVLLFPHFEHEDRRRLVDGRWIHHWKPWPEDQLERILEYVRRGGSLLVMAEHTTHEPAGKTDAPRDAAPVDCGIGENRFNDALADTAMRVRFDSAQFAVGGWLQSYQALAHPATAGLVDYRNQFGCVIGASVRTRWPARPLLVGRWGWNDPGDMRRAEHAQMGNDRYDVGEAAGGAILTAPEKLGDVVLAAEQRMGDGRIIAFGDTSTITNGITMGSHVFTSRLLAYLADGGGSPQAPWRGVLGLVAMAVLVAALAWQPHPARFAIAGLVLAAALAICWGASYRAARILPDGRGLVVRDASEYFSDGLGETPRDLPSDRADAPAAEEDEDDDEEAEEAPASNLAYIDFAHLPAACEESWRPDGTMGIAMTFMRCGYLTLDLTEFTPDRLERAGVLLSIAPRRAFSRRERAAVREFVEDGGIFILTVDYDDRGPSQALLSDFGLYVGLDPPDKEGGARVPQPLGHFKSPYLRYHGGYHFVRFQAAWPVGPPEPEEEEQEKREGKKSHRVIAYARTEVP
ncbi:MAG: hypothetical protein ACOC70_02405, partial [bacterium]